MRLFLDLGNTRLKWALEERVDAESFCQTGSVDCKEDGWIESVYIKKSESIQSVWASSVASDKVVSVIEQWVEREFNLIVNWLDVTHECCGVRNVYQVLSQLGVDRWAAILGAKSYLNKSGQSNCSAIVVDAGTAVTIDVLAGDSTFEGGAILPGLNMMHDSLVGRTAGIRSSLGGDISVLGKNTQQCVNSGVHYALFGAVERVIAEISVDLKKNGSDVLLLLTGGDAELIERNSSLEFIVLPGLVLTGLKYVANSGEFE